MIYRNSIFRACLIPIIILSVIEANFGILVLGVIADMLSYLASPSKNISVNMLVLKYATYPVFHYLIELVNNVLIHLTIQSVIRQAYKELLKEYLMISHKSYHKMGSGQLHTLIQRRTTATADFLECLICKVFKNLIYVGCAFRQIYYETEKSVFAANVCIFVMYLVSVHFVLGMRARMRLTNNDARNNVANKSYNMLVNYDVIKSYNRDDYQVDKLDQQLDHLEHTGVSFQIASSFTGFFQKISVVLPNALIIFLAFKDLYFTSIANYKTYVLYNGLFLSLKNVIGLLTTDLMLTSQYLTDLSDSRIADEPSDDDGKGLHITEFRNSIVFKNVTLRVEDRLLVLCANFRINKGEKVAIIGKNGTGKSSLVNVLLRFKEYDGTVYLDDYDINKIKKSSQRELISYVAQNPFINEGTVLDNLKYGNKSMKQDAIKEVCTEFGTHKCFTSLSNGYMTEVGEMGKFLSGGQRQQLSFMRGVLKNADIFIFDEPTSNLDKKAEAEMVSHIFNKLQDKTCMVILHSLEHLPKFDKIIGFANQSINVYKSYEDYLKDSSLY